MDVEPKIGGKPPKWMVKIMENPIKMDDLGVPLFFETPTYAFWGPAKGKDPLPIIIFVRSELVVLGSVS